MANKDYSTTKVILSFGGADHGAPFVHWLRDAIMKDRGYYGEDEVYVDAVALRKFCPSLDERGNELPNTSGGAQTAIKAVNGGTYTGLAAKNEDWNKYYKKAMSEAHTMIFVATEAWNNSEWCQLELAQYMQENMNRKNKRRTEIKGIALTFPVDTDCTIGPRPVSITFKGPKEVVATKVPAPAFNCPQGKIGGWVIDYNSLQKVLDEIPAEPK